MYVFPPLDGALYHSRLNRSTVRFRLLVQSVQSQGCQKSAGTDDSDDDSYIDTEFRNYLHVVVIFFFKNPAADLLSKVAQWRLYLFLFII